MLGPLIVMLSTDPERSVGSTMHDKTRSLISGASRNPELPKLNALSDFLNSGSIRSTWPARNSCFKPWRARIAV